MLGGFVLLGGCTEISVVQAPANSAGASGAAGAAGMHSAAAGTNASAPLAGTAARSGGAPAPPPRAGTGAEPVAAVDGVAMLGAACVPEDAKACAAREGAMALVCKGGSWVAEACSGTQRCDTAPGMTQGTCQPTLALCSGKRAGDAVCDGFRRRRCGANLLRFEAFDCAPNAHCVEASSAVSCACDLGFKDDGSGGCVGNIECPPAACLPGGQCVVGASDYSCECDVEYEGTGTKQCTPTGRCAEDTVCTGEYACRSRNMSYVCLGQFADWPMPSSVPGAKLAPSYMATADTVKDTVTGLTWQRNVPEMLAGCGALCSWQKAKTYCEKLELEGASDWRLPSLIELGSILDDNRVMPAIDPDNFPNTPSEPFWTASSSAEASDQAWSVDFGLFQVAPASKTAGRRVRCVR